MIKELLVLITILTTPQQSCEPTIYNSFDGTKHLYEITPNPLITPQVYYDIDDVRKHMMSPKHLLSFRGLYDDDEFATIYENQKDFQIRTRQFINHHLRGAPTAVWMESGRNFIQKERALEMMKKKGEEGGSGPVQGRR